jgi:hypothetical protein
MIDGIVRFFEALLRLNRALESLLVDILASYAPWLAPVVPAVLVFKNMSMYLGFEPWAALAGAIATETLGLSSIQTAVQFASWNAERKQNRAPFLAAVITGIFYLTIILVVNSLLDNDPILFKTARGLLSCLSVPAGVVIALRSQHSKRLRDAELQRQEAKDNRRSMRIASASLPFWSMATQPKLLSWRTM